MASLSEQLRTRIILPDGTLPRGALSRVAESLGVYPSTVMRWMRGKKPSPRLAIAVREMMKRKKSCVTSG